MSVSRFRQALLLSIVTLSAASSRGLWFYNCQVSSETHCWCTETSRSLHALCSLPNKLVETYDRNTTRHIQAVLTERIYISGLQNTYDLDDFHAMVNTSSLETFSIRFSSLKTLQFGSNIASWKMAKLDFSQNSIHSVDWIIIGTQSIKSFNISYNRLTSFNPNNISLPISTLEDLDLSHNAITMVTWYVFLSFHKMVTLNLSYNRIYSLDPFFLCNASMLVFDISSNNVHILNREMNCSGTLDGDRLSTSVIRGQLKTDLSKNYIQVFPVNYWCPVRRAFHWNLSGNPLVCECDLIQRYILLNRSSCLISGTACLPSSTYANAMDAKDTFRFMDNCILTEHCPRLCNCFFNNKPTPTIVTNCSNTLQLTLPVRLSSLRHAYAISHMLYFDHNNITVLSAKDYFKSVAVLDLSFNKINHLANTTWDYLVHVEKLNLKYNSLQYLEPFNISNTNMQELYLEANPWNCSCNLKHNSFRDWIREYNEFILDSDACFCMGTNQTVANTTCSLHHERSIAPSTGAIVAISVSFILLVLVFVLVCTIKVMRRYHLHKCNDACMPYHNQNYGYDAFISYSDDRSDFMFLRETLLPKLENELGLKVCVHDRDFLPGALIATNIVNSIRQSQFKIILLTKSYIEQMTAWKKFEIDIMMVECPETILLLCRGQLPYNDIPKNLRLILKLPMYCVVLDGNAAEWTSKLQKIFQGEATKPTRPSELLWKGIITDNSTKNFPHPCVLVTDDNDFEFAKTLQRDLHNLYGITVKSFTLRSFCESNMNNFLAICRQCRCLAMIISNASQHLFEDYYNIFLSESPNVFSGDRKTIVILDDSLHEKSDLSPTLKYLSSACNDNVKVFHRSDVSLVPKLGSTLIAKKTNPFKLSKIAKFCTSNWNKFRRRRPQLFDVTVNDEDGDCVEPSLVSIPQSAHTSESGLAHRYTHVPTAMEEDITTQNLVNPKLSRKTCLDQDICKEATEQPCNIHVPVQADALCGNYDTEVHDAVVIGNEIDQRDHMAKLNLAFDGIEHERPLCNPDSDVSGDVQYVAESDCKINHVQFVNGKLRVDAVFDERGGHITLPSLHVALTIPPGAIKQGRKQPVYLMVSLDRNHQPCCADSETLAATPIICGPNGLSFDKQVLLSHRIIPNEHCNYVPVICHDDDNSTSFNYSILDDSDYETRCFINGNQAYWFTSHFTGFAVKSSGTQSVGLQIYPFLEELEVGENANLRIRYFDCLDGQQQTVEALELSSGGRPVSGYPRTFYFDSVLGNVTVKAMSYKGWSIDEDDIEKLIELPLEPGEGILDYVFTPQDKETSYVDFKFKMKQENQVTERSNLEFRISVTNKSQKRTYEEKLANMNTTAGIVGQTIFPPELVHTLCICLDAYDGWKPLAGELLMLEDRQCLSINLLDRDKYIYSPTFRLLMFWEHRIIGTRLPTISDVWAFRDILLKIRRHDTAREIDIAFQNTTDIRYHAYPSHSDFSNLPYFLSMSNIQAEPNSGEQTVDHDADSGTSCTGEISPPLSPPPQSRHPSELPDMRLGSSSCSNQNNHDQLKVQVNDSSAHIVPAFNTNESDGASYCGQCNQTSADASKIGESQNKSHKQYPSNVSFDLKSNYTLNSKTDDPVNLCRPFHYSIDQTNALSALRYSNPPKNDKKHTHLNANNFSTNATESDAKHSHKTDNLFDLDRPDPLPLLNDSSRPQTDTDQVQARTLSLDNPLDSVINSQTVHSQLVQEVVIDRPCPHNPISVSIE